MGIHDSATNWWLNLWAIKVRLDTLEYCEDTSEMIELGRELSADIHSVLQSIDSELELDMEEDFNL